MQATPKKNPPPSPNSKRSNKKANEKGPGNKTSPSQLRAKSSHSINYATPPRPSPPNASQIPKKNDWNTMDRAKADAVFASTSSQWYAGAAFDRSPAAHTLPHPTKLLLSKGRTSTLEADPSDELLATSCPQSQPTPTIEYPDNRGTRQLSQTRVASPESKERQSEKLRTKSQDLLRMLKGASGGTPDQKSPATSPLSRDDAPAVSPPSAGEDVEELTRQVRKLLNLPNKNRII